MYILVVHWLGKFCVSLKALSRHRFFAHDEFFASLMSFLPIRVLANWIFKSICPFSRTAFLHNLMIRLSLFLILGLESSVITLFLFSTYSKSFTSKKNSWPYSVNPHQQILSVGQLLVSCLGWTVHFVPKLLWHLSNHKFFHRLTQIVKVSDPYLRDQDALKLPVFLNRNKEEWSFLITGSNAVVGFWEQWVFLLNDMLYRFWNLSNQWFKKRQLWSGPICFPRLYWLSLICHRYTLIIYFFFHRYMPCLTSLSPWLGSRFGSLCFFNLFWPKKTEIVLGHSYERKLAITGIQ